jgi:hypothetical protein
MASTFLLESEIEEEKFPMNPALIQKEQEQDEKLQQDIQKNVEKYRKRKLERADIVTHHKLIVIQKVLQKHIVAWYHHYLAHPGMTRLEATLPEKQAEDAKPWKRVDLDMIGPYKVKATNGNFMLRALTMIDPATGWFEVKDVPDYTANSTQISL